MQLALAVAIAIFVHLLAMAAVAYAEGMTVRAIAFGVGPRLFQVGLLRIGLLPIGGYVQLAMLADYPAGAPHPGAFELQPGWKRVLVPLSGPLALLVLASALLGPAALAHFTEGFGQLLAGALSPFTQAQALLQAAGGRLAQASLGTTLGLAACKLAALNLMPIAGSNGVQALLGMLPWHLLEDGKLTRGLAKVTLPLSLFLLGGWLLAIVSFLA